MTAIWAHRGSRKRAPENTIEAFALAVEEGADGIELDVHLSADGHLLVRHDPTIEVDGSQVQLASLTAAQARDLAGAPRLEEVYELLAPTSLTVNVEAKTGDAEYPGIVPILASTRRESGMADRVVFSSFNHFTLLQLRAAAPDAALAPLIADGLLEPWAYAARHGFDAMHVYAPLLGIPGVTEGFADAGIAVRAWTVNDAATAKVLIAAGIDALITDDPLLLA